MMARESRMKTTMEIESVMAITDMGDEECWVGGVISVFIVADRSLNELSYRIFLVPRSFSWS